MNGVGADASGTADEERRKDGRLITACLKLSRFVNGVAGGGDSLMCPHRPPRFKQRWSSNDNEEEGTKECGMELGAAE